MATTQYMTRQYTEFIARENRRLGRHDGERDAATDPFDKATDHDDDEVDDYALYRLGIK